MAQWLFPWGLAVDSPEPLSCTEAEVAPSSPPSGLGCHDYLSQAGTTPLQDPLPLQHFRTSVTLLLMAHRPVLQRKQDC